MKTGPARMRPPSPPKKTHLQKQEPLSGNYSDQLLFLYFNLPFCNLLATQALGNQANNWIQLVFSWLFFFFYDNPNHFWSAVEHLSYPSTPPPPTPLHRRDEEKKKKYEKGRWKTGEWTLSHSLWGAAGEQWRLYAKQNIQDIEWKDGLKSTSWCLNKETRERWRR